MTGAFAIATIAVALILAVWALVLVAINRSPNPPLVIGAAALELLLLIFAIGGIVQMLGADHDFAHAEFVGYLLGCIVVVPGAVWWMKDEKSRAASGVLAVVLLVVPILILRTQQVWMGSDV